jgi:hypothetical protein
MVAFDYSFYVSISYPTVFEKWKELNSDWSLVTVRKNVEYETL